MTGEPSPKRQRTEEPTQEEPSQEELELIQKVVDQVEKVNEELEKAEQEQAKEILVVESKYNKVKAPTYVKRAELLSQIPTFWKQVLVNHPLIGASVEKHDEQVLNHATSLDVTFVDDNGGFKIELKLKENPFVASKSLWKQVTFSDEDEATVTTSDIEWKTTDEAKEVAEHASFIQWFVSSEGEQDFAEFIKNEVWANPMPFYVNGESDDEDDDEDDEEGEGDDDDEEEADEEEAGDEDKE